MSRARDLLPPLIGAAMLALLAGSCTPMPVPDAPIAAAPVRPAPSPLVQTAAPAMDSETIAAAGRDLRMLGYGVSKTSDPADPSFQRAILAFQKDQGLAEDGLLTPALAEKLRRLRAQLPRTASAEQDGLFIYSDGSQRKEAIGLLPPPPAGLVSDAPSNFLQPLHPGVSGSYHLGWRGKDGFAPATTVTCRAGKIAPLKAPLGQFDVIPVTCHVEGKGGLQWRSFYAVKLGLVIRQEAPPAAGGTHALIAIRPLTASWPSAARIGLDWALSHALDTPASTAPILWSSTAVPPRFEIHAYAALSPHDAGLPGGNAPCRRFDLVQTGDASSWPGIACRNAKGSWILPQAGIVIASPASGLEKPAAPAL
jgi:hypothetical protein